MHEHLFIYTRKTTSTTTPCKVYCSKKMQVLCLPICTEHSNCVPLMDLNKPLHKFFLLYKEAKYLDGVDKKEGRVMTRTSYVCQAKKLVVHVYPDNIHITWKCNTYPYMLGIRNKRRKHC